MCNDNERKPTEEELKKIKVGFKVFLKDEKGKLRTPFQDTPIPINRWKNTEADEELNSSLIQTGFHVFADRDDCEKYANVIPWHISQDREIVVKKVDVRGIVAFGDINSQYYGYGLHKPQGVFRCSGIRIKELGDKKDANSSES